MFALVDGFVDGESVINSLVCDLSFDICETDDLQTLIIKDLEYRDDKNGYIYESVYIENINVSNLVYRLTNTDKARKKALFYYVFIVSWLPFILALLGYYFLAKGNILAILASILILFVFAIPSWKKASRVKKYYSSEFVNEKLNAEYHASLSKLNLLTEMQKVNEGYIYSVRKILNDSKTNISFTQLKLDEFLILFLFLFLYVLIHFQSLIK